MILVVAAIIVDSLVAPTRLLAARRSPGTALGGGWELPGGKVEPGEEPGEALRRELVEELSVEVEIGLELRNPAGDAWPINEGFAMRTWFVEIRTGSLSPTGGHDQLRWLAPAELLDTAWLTPDRPIVEYIRSWLNDCRPVTLSR